ncbi:MAG: amidohydrolase family protein [Oscillospiraceae bacterium]|nr:amidohydrolase family protein [Oscillospiraceae bacterium]
MNSFIIRGNFLESKNPNQFSIAENSYLSVTNGISQGISPVIPERYQGLPLIDFDDRMILPGMTDLHVHAPQFAFRGLGMDMELLDWLNTYAFPEEAKYIDLSYATKAYQGFVASLLHSTTTRAAIFGTVHVPATLTLMDELERSGLRTCVGKVNMDRNCPDEVRERDVETALRETEQWIQAAKSRFVHTRPIITPRFIPACSDALLAGLKSLQRRFDLPIQSHLSENLGEIEWVRSLHPEATCYGDAYERFGLFGGENPCIMAHCVHSGDEELELIHRNGVFIAHSPESNINLSSGVAPVSRYLELGLHVGLASDVAGGSNISLLQAMMHAIQASKLRWRLLDSGVRPLTLEQAFYLATVGGGAFFGKVGRFQEGYEFDAVVLDDSSLFHPQPLNLRSRLERAVYLADDRNITAKFVAGQRLF